MPRPLPPSLRPFEQFVNDRGPEIARRLVQWRRTKGRLPTGLSDDDVAQHALAELKRHYDRMVDESAAVNFAVTVGTNFVMDEYRAEKVRADEAWRAKVIARAGQPPTAEQAALTQIRLGMLADALRQLPARQRRVVELFYFERLKRKQIAAAMRVPESTVKGLLQRGLESLREHMKHAPSLVPLRLRRAGGVIIAAAPRVLTALMTLTVLSLPAPMVNAPHVEPGPLPAGRLWSAPPVGPVVLVAEETAVEPMHGPRTQPRASGKRPRPTGLAMPKGVKVGANLGDDQVGRLGGDEVCIRTGTGQEPFPPCANQNVVGTCPLLRHLSPLLGPYTTCERHSPPVYDPPPLP